MIMKNTKTQQAVAVPVRDIPGYPGYAVSRTGEVFSYKRNVDGRVIQGYTNAKNGGRYYAMVDENGKKNVLGRNLIVAKAYLENPMPETLTHVIPKDGNLTNIDIDNLLWVSAEDYKAYTELRAGEAAKRHFEEHKDEIMAKREAEGFYQKHAGRLAKRVKAMKDGRTVEFNSIKEASDFLGINQLSISNTIHGKQKQAGGYKWELA